MSGRKLSKADQELQREVRDRGGDFSPRQLEDWRYEGWVPRNEQIHSGWGGSASVSPKLAADQILALIELRKKGFRGEEIPLTLFVLGFPLDLDKLKNAYRRFFAPSNSRKVGRPPLFEDDAKLLRLEEQAHLAIRKGQKSAVLQLMRQRIEGTRERVYSQLLIVLTHLSHAFSEGFLLGEQTYGELPERHADLESSLTNAHTPVNAVITQTTGLTELVTVTATGIWPIATRAEVNGYLAAAMHATNTDTIAKEIERTRLAYLEWGRDAFRLIIDFSSCFTLFTERVSGLRYGFGFGILQSWAGTNEVSVAIGAILMLIIHKLVPANRLKALLDLLEEEIRIYKARISLLDNVSPDLWLTFGPEWEAKLKNLSPEKSEDRSRQIRAWAENHPELASLV